MTILSVLGKPGSGKGTQIDLLSRNTGYATIRTGQLLRELAEQDSLTGRRVRECLEKGLLIPTPVVFSLWSPRLVEAFEDNRDSGVLFDGNPRKVYEAMMLKEFLGMYGYADRFFAVHIALTDEEARRRLAARGREDDVFEAIEERLRWFRTDVQPVLDFYNQEGVLYEVNGEQAVEKVAEDLADIFSRVTQ